MQVNGYEYFQTGAEEFTVIILNTAYIEDYTKIEVNYSPTHGNYTCEAGQFYEFADAVSASVSLLQRDSNLKSDLTGYFHRKYCNEVYDDPAWCADHYCNEYYGKLARLVMLGKFDEVKTHLATTM